MDIASFLNKYFDASGVFKDNITKDITEAKMRAFAEDLASLLVEPESINQTKRFGFVDNITAQFSGLQVSTTNDPFIYIQFIYNDQPIFTFSEEESNTCYIERMFLKAYQKKNFNVLQEYEFLAKTEIESAVYDTISVGIGTPLELSNANSQFSRKKKFWIAYQEIQIAQSNQTNPPLDTIRFYYNYSYLTDLSQAVGDEFEIYFKAFADGAVQFYTFNYNYFTELMPVLAGKYYKLSVCMMPNTSWDGTGIPFPWATLQEVATPQNN